MVTNPHAPHFLQESRHNLSVLTLCSVIAAGLGALFADTFGDTYIPLMRMAVSHPVSIVGSVVSVFLPFLVFILIIMHSKPWLVYLICGIHIFHFSSTGFCLAFSFGSAGWLVRSLLQISDFFLIPVLLWFSLYSLAKNRSKQVAVCCISYAALIGMLDYCVISPFLADLINSYETMGRYAIHVGLDWCL